VTAWRVAARPPTLLAGATPVVVAAGIAVGEGVFRWDVFLVTLATAVLLNIAVNFANDASDAGKGVDGPERIGPPRAVASGMLTARQVWAGTAVVLALAAAGGIYLATVAGPVVLAIGAAAIIAALGYSGGPWPYGHHALGEPFVFVFFGPAAVVGSHFIYDGTAPAAAWWLSVAVGLTATAILVANNIRDIETDERSGKRTLAVLLGRSATRILYAILLLGAPMLVAGLAIAGIVPGWTMAALVIAPLALTPIRIVWSETDGPRLITALNTNARLHALMGLLIAAGAAI
jgi:1,4-dihydroxy-2-naphthoate octaprenyltransferase